MQGMRVGPMVRDALAESQKVNLDLTPTICPSCGGPVQVHGYVLLRPAEGVCTDCKEPWASVIDGPLCASCGYSKDHREGFGCRPDA